MRLISKKADKREAVFDYYDILFKYVMSLGIREIDGRTIVQETLEEAYLYFDKIKDKSKTLNWMKVVAKRKFDRYLADTKYGNEELVDETQWDIIECNTAIVDKPFAIPVGNFSDEYILNCLNQLNPLEKSVIELFYGKYYKLKEIAKILDISYNYTKNIKMRALRKLQEIMVEDKGEKWIG